MNLFEALSQELEHKAKPVASGGLTANNFAVDIGGEALVKPKSLIRSNAVSALLTKPILQLNTFPITLNPEKFKNPLSTSNPDGSLEALWNFRQLIDPIPEFSHYYSPSLRSTESTFEMIVKGASISNDFPFTSSVIAETQKKLAMLKYANMDNTLGSWAPVYASPSDWYDISNGRYKSLDFDLDKVGNSDSPFATIGQSMSNKELSICSNCKAVTTKSIAAASKVKKVSLKFMQVNLLRPWYNELLFDTNGWYLAGQQAGFCSSGRLDANDGTIPLLPTSVILATDVDVDADWSHEDQKAIDGAIAQGDHVSLGNVVISAPSHFIQVIGWITELTPFSPKMP
ncbi:hypothetical protein C942_02576 [Photobacterium marinum]|uniref:Uncharacterized protein n=2 Tax=Photobacterium marinum TaxID=1056511 RepID=L8J6J6_9GAMM|nr:hypothetical protein C942_02576 [Photobacterium marinum]